MCSSEKAEFAEAQVRPTKRTSGLPDGIFFKPKILIWLNFGGHCNGRCWRISWKFGIFYGHLIYFMDIWYIMWSLGIFCGHLVHFPRVGKLYQEKSGNPGVHSHRIPGSRFYKTNLCVLSTPKRFLHVCNITFLLLLLLSMPKYLYCHIVLLLIRRDSNSCLFRFYVVQALGNFKHRYVV
jgi:hypothetical protein